MLLHLDAGRQATAARISDEFSKKDMRDPAVRSAILHLAKSDNTVQKPLSEPTGLIWLCDEIGDWGGGWQSRHNVAPAPNFKRKYLLEHGWNANCAIGYLAKEHFSKSGIKEREGLEEPQRYSKCAAMLVYSSHRNYSNNRRHAHRPWSASTITKLEFQN